MRSPSSFTSNGRSSTTCHTPHSVLCPVPTQSPTHISRLLLLICTTLRAKPPVCPSRHLMAKSSCRHRSPIRSHRSESLRLVSVCTPCGMLCATEGEGSAGLYRLTCFDWGKLVDTVDVSSFAMCLYIILADLFAPPGCSWSRTVSRTTCYASSCVR